MSAIYAAMETRCTTRPLFPCLSMTVGAYFAVRLCLTYLFFQQNPQLGAAVSLALNLMLLAVVAFYSFGPGDPSFSSPLDTRCFRWVAFFLAFSFSSLCWGETVSLPIALAYWCAMAADVAMVLMLLRTGATEDIAAKLIGGYVVGACLIACVMWLSPTMQDLRLGNDEFFSPNAIGFTCAFGIFFAQFLSLRAKAWRLPAVFLAITLLRSLSKTTIVAFLISQSLLLFINKTIPRRNKVLMVVAAGAVLASFWSLILAYYDVYTNAGNQAETLTGRVGIWAFVLERSLERPWFGHGFNSFWKVIPPFGASQFQAWHAHNELLQQFYAYGVAGILMLIGIYGSFYRQVRRVAHPGHKAIFSALILFIVIRGFGDTERFDLSFPLWAIALLSLMLFALERPAEVAR
jgi:exopolysaccharide production protein ExoQ